MASVSLFSTSSASVHSAGTKASNVTMPGTEGITVEESTGRKIDFSKYTFRDEGGQQVTLEKLLVPGKPVILSFGYYKCPGLCGLIFNGIIRGTSELSYVAGQDYSLVNVSINSKETPELAAEKKANFLKQMKKDSFDWHFLVGDESSVRGLAQAIGYGYKWIEEEQEFAHASAVYVLTSSGIVSRIFYGIEYPPSQLKLALLEASEGKIGTIVDRIILFCYQYNPELRKYSMVLSRVMQLAAFLMVLAMAIGLGFLWRGSNEREVTASK